MRAPCSQQAQQDDLCHCWDAGGWAALSITVSRDHPAELAENSFLALSFIHIFGRERSDQPAECYIEGSNIFLHTG